jgi:polynucleotide 5'-hydroxyl-kinase GRC3/NOL9
MEIVPGAGWEDLFDELMKAGDRAVILGATDSGKSTLARYLMGRLLGAGISVCLVDADVGQSALGLPGTISMKRFAHEKDLKDYRFRRMFFVGDVNPAKRISFMIRGTKRMTKACGEASDVTFIDTTGLISGRAAEALKIGKIRAINPRHIVALQRENELETLLRLVPDVRIHRPGVSPMARTRKAPERSACRRKKLADYFNNQGSAEFRLNEKDVSFFYKGKKCELSSGLFPEGTVIGLNRGEQTLALGIVIEARDGAVTFRSPLASLERVSMVEFGDIRLTLPLQEAGVGHAEIRRTIGRRLF